jgi:uncharacterized protein
MISDDFEWDDDKAVANVAKHGVSFDDATLVFDDPNASDDLDDSIAYGEERWLKAGMSKGKLLVVVYTERSGRFRLISARHGERRDYDDYYRST